MIKPKVVILGGGFGGLTAARAMAKTADVTVVIVIIFKPFCHFFIKYQRQA